MPIATRTFRVFVSSTFEDLVEERNALQREVFPKLSKVCEDHGARFQAIDLRWGVRDEAVLGQQMMEICLAEIERCQRTGIKPNFIVLLGDRYGRPPLPARIPAQEFETVVSRIGSAEDRVLVENWYQRDDNAVPAEYLLKPRTGDFMHANRWIEVEHPLREALREAARAAGLSNEALLKYEGSASHQEIVKGLGTTPEDRRHVFAFFRATDVAKEPAELRDLKSFLRGQLGENVFDYEAGDLEKLCCDVAESLERVILDEASGFESRLALELEIEAHDMFAKDRSQHFVGRKPVLDAITEYLKSQDRRPLVIHGPSGSGKSAIIARASEDRKGIRRFIGATPESSNGLTLLRSLCEEISRRYGEPEDAPDTFDELAVTFSDRIRLATPERSLTLYVDALDQLGAQDPAAVMNWLPLQLPLHSKIVVSSNEVPAALRRARLFQVAPFPPQEADLALKLWLEEVHRTLQPEQWQALVASFGRSPLPLYLKLAFEEARRWKSLDGMEQCVLGEGLAGIIGRLFDRLSEQSNHGPMLVSHVLGYLASARHGLTEDEILAVLSEDKEVLEDFERRKHYNPPERRLPVIVWSRLYLDLEPYLTERSSNGGTLISYYHRQLAEVVDTRFLEAAKNQDGYLPPHEGEESVRKKSAHEVLADFFRRKADPEGSDQWNGPARCLTELSYHLYASDQKKALAGLWESIPYIDARIKATDLHELSQDFRWLPEPSELARELHRLFIRNVQRLKEYRGLFFSLIHHEGSSLLRTRCDELVQAGRWHEPWILTKSVSLPSPTAEADPSVAVATSFRFPTSTATAINSPVSLVFYMKSLGQIGLADPVAGREHARSLICRKACVWKLCASSDGTQLAVAYEDGSADLIAIEFAADQSLVEQRTVATLRFLIPEVEPPFLTWGGDHLLYQREDGELTLFRSSGESETLAVPKRCIGELSGAVFENGQWVVTLRQGLDTWILAYFSSEVASTQRPASDVTTLTSMGRHRVAIGFSDNHLILFRTEGRISVEHVLERRSRPVCAAGNGDLLLWVESDADAYLWGLEQGKPPTKVQASGVFSTGSAAAAYFERPSGMVLSDDHTAWVLTPSGLRSLTISQANDRDRPIYQVLPGAKGTFYSIQLRENDYWLVDSQQRRECCVVRGKPGRQYFAVNELGQLLAASDLGGAVWTDLETLKSVELPDTPISVNSLVPATSGFWLADRFGGIFYVGHDKICHKAAHIALGSLAGPALFSWPGGLLWHGVSSEQNEQGNPFGDSNLHLVFFSVPVSISQFLDPVRRRMFPKKEGVFQTVCYDAATNELILILAGTAHHGSCARLGTVAQFLVHEERCVDLDFGDRIMHGAMSQSDDAVYLLSETEMLFMLDRTSFRTRAVLASSQGFNCLAGSSFDQGLISVVESGRRVFTCEGGRFS